MHFPSPARLNSRDSSVRFSASPAPAEGYWHCVILRLVIRGGRIETVRRMSDHLPAVCAPVSISGVQCEVMRCHCNFPIKHFPRSALRRVLSVWMYWTVIIFPSFDMNLATAHSSPSQQAVPQPCLPRLQFCSFPFFGDAVRAETKVFNPSWTLGCNFQLLSRTMGFCVYATLDANMTYVVPRPAACDHWRSVQCAAFSIQGVIKTCLRFLLRPPVPTIWSNFQDVLHRYDSCTFLRLTVDHNRNLHKCSSFSSSCKFV